MLKKELGPHVGESFFYKVDLFPIILDHIKVRFPLGRYVWTATDRMEPSALGDEKQFQHKLDDVCQILKNVH